MPYEIFPEPQEESFKGLPRELTHPGADLPATAIGDGWPSNPPIEFKKYDRRFKDTDGRLVNFFEWLMSESGEAHYTVMENFNPVNASNSVQSSGKMIVRALAIAARYKILKR